MSQRDRNHLFIILCIVTVFCASCSKKDHEKKSVPEEQSPAPAPVPQKGSNVDVCTATITEDVVNYFEKGNVPVGRVINLTGFPFPHGIIWERGTSQYMVTKYMGTGGRFLLIKELKRDEEPGVSGQYTGYFVQWKNFPIKGKEPLKNALLKEAEIKIDDDTYFFMVDEKPAICMEPEEKT